MSRFTHGCPLRNCTANCEYSFFVKEIIGVFVLMESEELVVALRSNANVSNTIPILLKLKT